MTATSPTWKHWKEKRQNEPTFLPIRAVKRTKKSPPPERLAGEKIRYTGEIGTGQLIETRRADFIKRAMGRALLGATVGARNWKSVSLSNKKYIDIRGNSLIYLRSCRLRQNTVEDAIPDVRAPLSRSLEEYRKIISAKRGRREEMISTLRGREADASGSTTHPWEVWRNEQIEFI